LNLILPKQIFSKVMRAVVEFDMIQDGDKILIGLSGGKDSQLLAYALATLKQRTAKKFTLAAITINPNFDENFISNAENLKNFCAALEIPYQIHEVDIFSAIQNCPNKSPCFTCAYFRRAAINRIATEIGANKVAYAHHLDDAVETFFMSLLSSGQLTVFTPKTFLSRTNITVIRPLIYLREFQISSFVNKKNFNIVKSPCPIDGKTNRQNIKNLIVELGKSFPDLFEHLAAAMRESSIGELWSAPKTQAEMRQIYFSYINRR
jgi:tRNA(Ile)-lysidine synthetase-like protein